MNAWQPPAGTHTPGALKRGRNPRWPYVPTYTWQPADGSRGYSQQIRGKAYATRAEALEYATRYVERLEQRAAAALEAYRERHR